MQSHCPEKIIYPNGRELSYNYANGLDDSISRLSSISDNSATLETYAYLGLGTVVRRDHPEPGVELTFIAQGEEPTGDAGDHYTGLDRFGRVVDQRWLDTIGETHVARTQYGYNTAGNVAFQKNLVDAAFSELYSYDDFGQLTGFARGTLNGSNDEIASPTRSQEWDLDALGNWLGLTTDGGSPEERDVNYQNQYTGIGGNSTAYDANGNLTIDAQGRHFIYDAWNRLVRVEDDENNPIAAYGYDGLGRRILETHGETTRELFYSARWQVLEERVDDETTAQYVWSPVYVDALILRDRFDGEITERLYAVQDANFNVVALLDDAGTVLERFIYDSYGNATVLDHAWDPKPGSDFAWQYLRQGTRRDLETGQDDSRMRVYDPHLGRPLQSDPLGLAPDVNPYRWERNSPANLLDPTGLYWVWIRTGVHKPAPYIERRFDRVSATQFHRAYERRNPNGRWATRSFYAEPHVRGPEYRWVLDGHQGTVLSGVFEWSANVDMGPHQNQFEERQVWQDPEPAPVPIVGPLPAPDCQTRSSRRAPTVNESSRMGFGTAMMAAGATMMSIGATGSAAVLADDLTVIGVADDPLLILTGGVFVIGGATYAAGGLVDWLSR